MNTEVIAQMCHEVNRLWCIQTGDMSQKSWSQADQWQRDSALMGVEFALKGATPEQQHDAWCQDKLDAGWMWGPTKDPEKKKHPCLVGYDSLPSEQKTKDKLFVAIVTALKD